VSVDDVLQERLGTLGIPVLSGVPAGHVDDNMPLPLGADVELDADAGTLAFEGGHA
jgi:muramoyltetrapeptide carboxypeptidase